MVVFANRAAEDVFGAYDKVLGQSPGAIGMSLLYQKVWSTVLDKLDALDKLRNEGDRLPPFPWKIDESDNVVDVTVAKRGHVESYHHFRALLSTLKADDGLYYVLSLERSSYVKRKLLFEEPTSESTAPKALSDTHLLTSPSERAAVSNVSVSSRDILRLEGAVFDSSDVPGYIISADGSFYVANTKVRELFGDIMGGDDGCESSSLQGRLDFWDETMSRKLTWEEFPGTRLVKARTGFKDFKCTFAHAVTGEYILLTADGTCLYDHATGEFLGGIVWCRDLHKLTEEIREQQQNRRLQSHETTCNLMPHLVWTSTVGGKADWYSQRVRPIVLMLQNPGTDTLSVV